MHQRTALHYLGVTSADIEGCIQAPSIAIARQRLERMKDRARWNYYRLAASLNEDDDHETLHALAEVLEQLESVTIPSPLARSLRRVA